MTGLVVPVLPLLLLSAVEPVLVRVVAGAEVDFGAGTVTARGGAAADLRMPSPDTARPGAERRARAAAVARLRAALEALGEKAPRVEAALAKARTSSIDYQSNGGVLLSLAVAFADLGEPTGAVTLSVAAMPLELAPTVVVGAEEARLGSAVYRTGAAPAGARALAAKRDKSGRLVIAEPGPVKLAGAAAVIYVGKVTR